MKKRKKEIFFEYIFIVIKYINNVLVIIYYQYRIEFFK